MRYILVILICVFIFSCGKDKKKNERSIIKDSSSVNQTSKDKSLQDSINKIQLIAQEYLYAEILQYKFGYDHFTIFVPNDLTDYPLIKSNPLTAYLFVTSVDENKIKDLSVEKLKSRHFSGSDIPYHFYYIKGYEKYNLELAKIDEFDLTSRKTEFTDALVECWKAYNEEYERLMQKNISVNVGFYSKYENKEKNNEYFKKGDDNFNRDLFKYKIPTNFYQVTKEKYSFDKGKMKFPFPVLGKHSGGQTNWSWTRLIKNAFGKEIMEYSNDGEFSELIPSDIAKKLVQPSTYGHYKIRLKLKKNFNNEYWEAGVKHLIDFEVIGLIMEYYDNNVMIFQKIF